MKRRPEHIAYPCAAAAGLLTALAVCLPEIPALAVPLGFLGTAPYWYGLFLLFRAAEGRRGHGTGGKQEFLSGALFGAVTAMGGWHWLWYLPGADWLTLSRPALTALVLAAWLLLAAACGVRHGVSAVLLGLFFRRMKRERRSVCLPLCAAGLWMLSEAAQGITWHGVPVCGIPWLRLSLSVTGAPVFLQAAALGGSLLVGGLLVVCGAWIGFGLPARGRERRNALLCAVLLTAAAAGAGTLRLRLPETDTERTFTAAAVQGNLRSSDRWSAEGADLAWERYASLTLQGMDGQASAAGSGAELTVWTESAVPLTLDGREDLAESLSSLARACDTTLVTGLFHRAGEVCYNSVYAVSPRGGISEEPYSKRIPVPFGEYVPAAGLLTGWFPSLAELNPFGKPITPGTSAEPLASEVGRIGALVCFDAAYAYPARETVLAGAEVLVLVSNNAWFSDSAACRQAVGHAVLRAAETGRDLICSASTGISVLADARGTVRAESAAGETGVLFGEATPHGGRTPFLLFGEGGVTAAVFCLLLFLYIFPGNCRKKRRNPSDSQKTGGTGKKFEKGIAISKRL